MQSAISINTQSFMNLMRDFNTVTGMRTGLFDTDYQEIVSYPKEQSPFCCVVRTSPEGLQACLNCDQRARIHAAQTQKTYQYFCHAGLMEVMVPLRVDSKIAGFLVSGQIRVNQTLEERTVRYLEELVGAANLQQALFQYYNMEINEPEKVQALARIMQQSAIASALEHYILIVPKSLSGRVEAFVRNHLDKNLSLDVIAREFEISKTTLCTTVQRETGQPVSAIVRRQRLLLAQEYLLNSDKSIAEISDLVGFRDYNYFSKYFRQHMEITPSAFRHYYSQGNCRQQIPDQSEALA